MKPVGPTRPAGPTGPTRPWEPPLSDSSRYRPVVELLRNLLARTLGLGTEKPERLVDELSLAGIARYMQSEKCRRVVCM
uniref:Uncharacterized protein n=1 Tax=Coturnix japonica TaxID=93934 RepID=A0A8C2SQZ5_COTJA